MTCTCSHQERMGFPCCHIGCVLAEPDCDGIVMFPDMSGFPISSVRVFWWSIMYRYGTSGLPQHQELRMKLLELSYNDTPGFMLSLDLIKFDGHIRPWPSLVEMFHKHPRECLLNYTVQEASEAWQIYLNGMDPSLLDPPGLSQKSFLSQDVELVETVDPNRSFVETVEIDKDLNNVQSLLRNPFHEMCNAISDSSDARQYVQEAAAFMNNIASQARSLPKKEYPAREDAGTRVSMVRPTNRKRKHTASRY